MALDKICAWPPTPWAAWIHLIHTAGGVGGSITMEMLFVLFVRSHLVVVNRCM